MTPSWTWTSELDLEELSNINDREGKCRWGEAVLQGAYSGME